MFKALCLAIAIVAHEPGYYTALSKHIQRWLAGEGVSARVITPDQMQSALVSEPLTFLVGFANPTPVELRTLRNYRARGGKMVVFHSASAALGELMGVRPLGYSAAPYPGAWSRMVFDLRAKSPAGLPASILQTSTVLQRAVPVPARGRVLATWADRKGRSTGEPAWIATDAGYWMTHVLLADGDEDLKARLVAAFVGSVSPRAWSPAAHEARQRAKIDALRAYAAKQTPRRGEIHAVWDHSGCGLYPGDWPRTIRTLSAAHVTDLFVNVAGAGFAHYPSSVLPRSKTFEQEGDQLAAVLSAAKGSGIRVHAWILCFSGTRGTPERQEIFRKRGWRLSLANGRLTEYLDPSKAAVRDYILSALDEITSRYAVSGIHLDFVRWGDGTVRPKDASASVTSFVAAARRRVKRPLWLTTAVYGKYPQCVSTVGQDWKSWLDMNLVDYVVPMDYTESKMALSELLLLQSMPRADARRTIVGLGVTANESRLDARQVIDQINLTRSLGFAGNALFDLDTTLEKQILPYLKMGLW